MAKKLTAKIQKLNPKLPQFSNILSGCINIEPETQEILLKKGTVYAVFEITGDSNFNTEFVNKVINDILRDSYYIFYVTHIINRKIYHPFNPWKKPFPALEREYFSYQAIP